MTLKFYFAPDAEKFIKMVEASCGNVLLRLSDQSLRNLKNDKAASTFLAKEAEQCHGIEIHLSDKKDYSAFVSLMMEGCA